MALVETPAAVLGKQAADFTLLGVDGQYWTLAQCMGSKGLVVMFICNHCPYVQAIHQRILRDAHDLLTLGVKSVAIMPNDVQAYPQDPFANMQRIAQEHQYPFPYLYDATQAVAKAYDAVCTPEFFGINTAFLVQYRGRLDASRKELAPENAPRELVEAMKLIAATGQGPVQQLPSIGCSIKWQA